MDFSTLYWILILPKISITLGTLASLTLGGGLVSGFLIWLFASESADEGASIATGKKIISNTLKTMIPVLILVSFIPTQKMMMYMIGGYAVTNIEGIEKLPKNVIGAANKFLEDFNIEEKK